MPGREDSQQAHYQPVQPKVHPGRRAIQVYELQSVRCQMFDESLICWTCADRLRNGHETDYKLFCDSGFRDNEPQAVKDASGNIVRRCTLDSDKINCHDGLHDIQKHGKCL